MAKVTQPCPGRVAFQDACAWFGVSRQAIYQADQRHQQRLAEDDLILEMVHKVRQRHPRMGGRKLYHELQPRWSSMGIARGRDRFFDLLRANGLLVPVKRSTHRTTRSGLWRCKNLYAGFVPNKPLQAWVGDITYLRTEQGFLYLTLLTDAYSRFIVGYDLSDSLALDGCLRALNLAISQTGLNPLAGLIHHSDHGVQYTSGPYLDRLQAVGIRPSMGEVGNCYDNALAERMNGILKCEYGLDDLFVNYGHADVAVPESIWLYNYERPHLSLGYRKPADIHFGNHVH